MLTGVFSYLVFFLCIVLLLGLVTLGLNLQWGFTGLFNAGSELFWPLLWLNLLARAAVLHRLSLLFFVLLNGLLRINWGDPEENCHHADCDHFKFHHIPPSLAFHRIIAAPL